MKSSIDISYRRLLSMLMHRNTSIIMASTIAAILTISVLTFALPNQAFAQPTAMLGGGSLKVGVYGGAAPYVRLNAPGLALRATGGTNPSVAVKAGELGLSAVGGTVRLALPGGIGCWPCPECGPTFCPVVGGGSGVTR